MINEQTTDSSGNLTVNALHATITIVDPLTGITVSEDIIVASATSGVTCTLVALPTSVPTETPVPPTSVPILSL